MKLRKSRFNTSRHVACSLVNHYSEAEREEQRAEADQVNSDRWRWGGERKYKTEPKKRRREEIQTELDLYYINIVSAVVSYYLVFYNLLMSNLTFINKI